MYPINSTVFYVDANGRVFSVKVIANKPEYTVQLNDGSQTRTSEFNLFLSERAANVAAMNRISQKLNGVKSSENSFQK